jgi:hypothetical protein
MIQPDTGGRAGKQVVVPGKCSPDPTGVGLCTFSIDGLDSKGIHRDTLAVQHADHVVVRFEQQVHGIREALVKREPRRIRMTMWADNRQIANGLV